MLLIDSGNSRIKWGLHDGKSWVALGHCGRENPDELASAWKTLAPSSALGSNVAGIEAQAAIESLLPEIEFEWISARSSQCGVRNGYTIPEQLGSDRWAALIAAKSLLPDGGIVVGLGTAMTADILSREGRFEGGIIMPGLKAMTDSLKKGTKLDFDEGRFDFPAKSTADGVSTGAVLALSGAIEKISRLRGNPQCLIFGGDAPLVVPHLEMKATLAENLVLEGLLMIAGESR